MNIGRINIQSGKSKPGDRCEILLVIVKDLYLRNLKKGKYPEGKHPLDQSLKSNQPYEIFPSLFYLPDNTTLVKVVECGTYG